MMKQQTVRTAILFLFIGMVFYCYGAGMMDYFAIYKPWKLIPEADFAGFHQYQGQFVINIFVIPSAVMTLLNILVFLFPPRYLGRKLPGLALAAYAFDWIFSFTMQIPIQLELEKGKSMELLDELLRTNWWRFTADTIQFVIVCMLLWQLLRKLEKFAARSDNNF
ncbi:hypothetical protein [Chitinophaga sp. YIM B06452]|uniref:hypothetical protein n=1 Tax=Chitinophaga sp. YIM B06452 TaxID=3082158 RepID=UPI0031FEF844